MALDMVTIKRKVTRRPLGPSNGHAAPTSTRPANKTRSRTRHPWRIIPSPTLLKQLMSGPVRHTYLYGTLVS